MYIQAELEGYVDANKCGCVYAYTTARYERLITSKLVLAFMSQYSITELFTVRTIRSRRILAYSDFGATYDVYVFR